MWKLIVAATALAAVPAALSAAPRTVTAPAPVIALAADGPRIAYVAGRSAIDCNRVFVWQLGKRTITKLGRKTHCEQTSTGNSIAAVSIVGTRVLWVHYVGGNQRRWSLWTATTTRPSPVLLRSVEVEAESPAPIVIGEGDAERDLVAYAVGTQVTGIRESGARAFRWVSPSPVTALGAHFGRVAVARADGHVTLLSDRGTILIDETVGTPISAVFQTESGSIAQVGRDLVYTDGETTYEYRSAFGSKLVDGRYTRALVIGGDGIVREIELRTKRTVRAFGRGGPAQLEPAYGAVASGRTVRLLLRAPSG